MFANYTHCGGMLIFGYSKITDIKKLRATLGLDEKLLYTEEKMKSDNQKIQIEVSENDYGDFIIRCLSDSAEKIQNLFELVRNSLR